MVWDPYAEFRQAVLPNGLTVHAGYWPGRTSEAVRCLIHSGAAYDPPGLEGTAHFLEHLVSDSGSVPRHTMESFFQDLGGGANFGVTSFNYTQYGFFIPAQKAAVTKSLAYFGDMLFAERVGGSVEHERKIITGEFHRRYPHHVSLDLDKRNHASLYHGHWMERFVRPFGLPESIERISGADVQGYYDTYYTPANMSIVAVGGLQLEELLEVMSGTRFLAERPGQRALTLPPLLRADPLPESRYVFSMSEHLKTAGQVGEYKSFFKLPFSVPPAAFKLTMEMLDRELTKEVREKRQWAYHIGTQSLYVGGCYEGRILCGGLSLSALDHIESVIESVITSLSGNEDLFEAVKRQALAKVWMQDPNIQGTCSSATDDLVESGNIIPLSEYSRLLSEVSMEDVCLVLESLHPSKRWTLVIRP